MVYNGSNPIFQWMILGFCPPMSGLTPICKHLNFPFLSRTRQGLMYQQQELYRHQQEALARLQDEADRLRQETLGILINAGTSCTRFCRIEKGVDTVDTTMLRKEVETKDFL